MRRLEYTRRIRSVPGRARNTAEAAMYLAHVTRERHRLQQERTSLEKRIRRIEKRLTMIADTEGKLVPALQCGAPPADASQALPAARAPRQPESVWRPAAMVGTDPSVMEIMLQY
jgi:hypothetical protein